MMYFKFNSLLVSVGFVAENTALLHLVELTQVIPCPFVSCSIFIMFLRLL
jgi:hypothetical protein